MDDRSRAGARHRTLGLTQIIPVRATNGDLELAGSVWKPIAPAPRGLIMMHPGSGPSDRDNDVLFAPIREAFLDLGVAVAAFDKRGVGESTGSWLDAGIPEQAEDLARSLHAARAVVPTGPVGLFGHSQGGWVVVEAARATNAEFVITNSGPAVSPRVQETFSTANTLRAAGWSKPSVRNGLAVFTELMNRAAGGAEFADARIWMRDGARRELIAQLTSAGVFVPDSEAAWAFTASIIDHDPRPALEQLTVPLLVLLGGADPVVPVDESAAVFRACVRSELLDLQILPAANHRLQGPGRDAFAPGYLDALTAFVAARLSF